MFCVRKRLRTQFRTFMQKKLRGSEKSRTFASSKDKELSLDNERLIFI